MQVPAVFQSFYCNFTLYKPETSLTKTNSQGRSRRCPSSCIRYISYLHFSSTFLMFCTGVLLLRNSLYRAVRKLRRNFGFFCSVNHLSGPLRKHMFTCTNSKDHGLWLVIGGFQSVLFVSCFKLRRFVIALFQAIIDELSFLIFFILVTCKNKATSASFLRQKIHSPSRFPSLFLSSLESFSVKLGEHVTLWFALTMPSQKWLTEQETQVCKTRSAIQPISL